MNKSQLIVTLKKLYQVELSLLLKCQDLFLLTIRLYWGWRFLKTGLGKFQNFEGVVSFFTSLGIPAPEVNVVMAAGTELIGGLFLMLGLASRIVTIPLIFTMIVAYLTAHRDSVLNILNDSKSFTQQEPFLFLLACLIVLLFGAGKYSVDRIIEGRTK